MMLKLNLTRRNLFAIFLGFLVILMLGIITSGISFLISSQVAQNVSPQNFEAAFSQQPILTFSWILRILSFASPILGGIVVGMLIREKGWLYGGLLGVVLTLLSIGIVLLAFFVSTSLIYGQNVPASFGQNLAQKNILNQFINAPLIIVSTAFGGWLGEKLYKNRKS